MKWVRQPHILRRRGPPGERHSGLLAGPFVLASQRLAMLLPIMTTPNHEQKHNHDRHILLTRVLEQRQLPSHSDAPTWVHQAGIPHLIGVGLRLTAALTSPYGQMPVLIPTVVPLVPANQANQSSLHNAHLPQMNATQKTSGL